MSFEQSQGIMAVVGKAAVKNMVLGIMGTAPINWYPGHMAVAMQDIRDRLKAVDIVLEVRDARIPLSSANEDLERLLTQKKHLIIMNKMDLANSNLMNKWKEYFKRSDKAVLFVNGHNKDSAKQVLAEARTCISSAINKQPTLLAMIVGVPNVGKSVLTNALHHVACSSLGVEGRLKAGQVGPLPGVTRQLSGYKIGHSPSIYLLDTPGVLLPNLSDIETGLKLALTGAIKDSVVGEERIARYLLLLLNSRHSSYTKWRVDAEGDRTFETNVRGTIASSFLEYEGDYEDPSHMGSLIEHQMSRLQRVFGISPSVDDIFARVARKLLPLYRAGKLGSYTWDIVPEQS